LNEPEKYDGVVVEVPGVARVSRVMQDGFYLTLGKNRIKVKGTVKNLNEGDFVALVSVFHKEGYLELKEVRVRTEKMYSVKIIVSLLATSLVLIWFFRTYGFHFRKGIFVPR